MSKGLEPLLPPESEPGFKGIPEAGSAPTASQAANLSTPAAAIEEAIARPPRFDPELERAADAIIAQVGGKPETIAGKLVKELIITSAKLLPDGRSTGELKLMTNAVKELRYAYRVFSRYEQARKVTIFGSARTPPAHPDYAACVDFSRRMAAAGWMSITGAGLGIMHAGHVGPGRGASFGVAIRLPFETTANEVIAGDEKLIQFRYFFTRKLMFISQAEAVALFPGGFGTLDEAFEALTLVQTGKAQMVPIVMLEGEGGDYWRSFDEWIRAQPLKRGWISPEDTGLYSIAPTAQVAVEHIERFYRVYHSMRYIRDTLVIRLHRPISEQALDALNTEFRAIVKEGSIVQRGAFDIEEEHRELPRLAFVHTRSKFGLVRRMIDRINESEAGH
ncbi:MAG: LOG family protein [Planctomycetota bacterium]|nr:LOG family protein [Planctomycetota bacterium]